MKLYEIVEGINELNNLEEFDQDVIKDTMESLGLELEVKIENIVKLIKNYKSDIDQIKIEEGILNKKRKSLENKTVGIKNYLEDCIKQLPNKRFENALFKVYMQKNNPSLDIEEGAKIPKIYWIEPLPILDRKSLLESVKAKITKIDGVTLKQTESVRIR